MKTLKVFFVLFLILLEACNPAPTEPNVPPEPVVIVTIPFVEVTTTATTASIKSTVNTNGPTSIAVEYGVGNYGSSTNAVPATFKVNTVVNTEISNLIPNTRYQFRTKVSVLSIQGSNSKDITLDSAAVLTGLSLSFQFKEVILKNRKRMSHTRNHHRRSLSFQFKEVILKNCGY